jgi:S-adenosylmethionine decarboxylase
MESRVLGRHLIVDVWGEIMSMPFWDMDGAAVALKQAAIASKATILTERWHHFGLGFGYTGVIVLAESHISVHTYPENGYAGLDVFMCGECDPRDTLDYIKNFYKTENLEIKFFDRGKIKD